MLAYTQKEVAKRHDSAKANNAVTLRRLCVKDDFAVRRDILVLKIVRISTTYHPRIEIVRLTSVNGERIGQGFWSDLNESSIWKSDVSIFRAFSRFLVFFVWERTKLQEFCMPRIKK